VPWLTPLLRSFVEQPWVLNPLRLASAFLLLLIPSTAMGATLPLLVAALYRRSPQFGRVLGLLYGWNTLGAVLGALIGEVLLVGWFGIRGTALVAASANCGALALALALAGRLDAYSAAARSGPAQRFDGGSRLLLVAAFLSGAIVLALEVVWFRLLLLKILGTSLAFAIMLAVVLAGIALGGLAGSAWLGRARGVHRGLPAVALASGVLCVASYAFHGQMIAIGSGVVSSWEHVLYIALPLMLPVSFLSGVIFTAIGEALHERGMSETRAAGLLTLANTSGAMLGPLLGGFLMLPRLGIERSFQWLAAAYGLVALVLYAAGGRPAGRLARAALAAAAVAFAAGMVFFPRGAMRDRYLADTLARFERKDGAVPVAIREGLTETAIYLRTDLYGEPMYHRLVTNSHSMSGTMLRARRYMRLFVHLPVALHPEPRTALVISFGVGTTARALVETRELEHIDVVDVSRDIFEMAAVVHPVANPLDDSRVHVHVEDGRYFLQTAERRFDIITGEPPPPKAAGIVNLYSEEYFALLRERLNEGGIASYWLPVHNLLEDEGKAIIRAFCNAFDDCSLWTGTAFDWILVGTRNARGPVAPERFAAQWRDPMVGRRLVDIGVETPGQLAALFLYDADDLALRTADVAPVVDDRPKRLGSTMLGIDELSPTWLPWLDVEESRARFEASGWVLRFLPREVRDRAWLWFDARRAAHRHFIGTDRDRRPPLERAHGLMERTPLVTAPLWELGSSDERQRAARAARAHGRDAAELDFELGLGALARREWGAASELLGRAARASEYRERASRLEAYALCRAGRADEVRKRVDPLVDGAFAEFLRRDVDPACAVAPTPVNGFR
jgi:spermidine synthase